MANTSGINITGNLTLNPQSINAASKQVQQALGRITGQASEFQKSLDASTARVFAFGATTSILNGVSQAFKGLIANTINVEKRLTEIGTIIGSTGSQLNDFRNTIFDVAKTTGQSFNVVADAASELARQGLNAEETAKRLESALVLTRISGLDSVKSVKALTAAINGFSSAGLTAEQITNKLVAVDTAFAVSAQDLAEAFSRAGSTAEDAGVSFDELLGIVTAVEQTTSRGGAVIGNALKSIFTRLGRGSVVEDLRELGVEINSSQSGVQKLQALSQSLENISDPTVANKIKELAGGVYQINIVSAALKDLGSDTSIFSQAASKSASAMDEAFTKNAALNEMISSQMNALVVGLTNLSEKIGTITFGPIIKNLLSLANEFTSFLETAFDPEKGNKFIQGIFDAIGNFLSGPGLVLITTGFLKIFSLVAKFAKEGFKTVLQIGSESEKIKNIESGIVGLLSRDQQLRAIIASSTATQAQKEQAVINAIKAENDLLRQQEQLLRSIATAAAQRGVVGYSPDKGFAGKGKKTFATGFMVEEAQARMLGASPNVKAKMSKGKIGGQKFIMNNEEIEIPKFGKNGDSAVIPMYNKGYIPNFAKYIYDSDRITPDKGATLKAVLASQVKKNLIIGPAGSGKSTLAGKMGKFLSNADDVSNATEIDILSGAARAKGGGISKNLEAIISAVNGSDGKVSYLYAKNLDILSRRAGRTVAEEGDLRSKKQLKGTTYAPLNQFDFMGYVKSKSRNFNLINAAKGFIPNFADPLKEAIDREMSAGVPASQIYVDQNSSLKNSMNPMGLMVANRRDEPAGGIQGISRARKEGANPKLYGAARGFIPNYAPQLGNAAVQELTIAYKNESQARNQKAKELKEQTAGRSTETAGSKAPDDIDGKVKSSFEKFSGASIALSMALSSVPSLIGPTEELDSSMTSAAKIFTSSAAQYASIGSVFGPYGTAVGAATGMIMSAVDAYKQGKELKQEEARIQEEVNKKLKGSMAVRKGRQEAFGSETNKDAASAQQDLIKALKDRNMSIKPLQDAESNLKKIYEEQTSTEEDKNEASFKYIEAIKRAKNSLGHINFTEDFAKKIQESAAKFSKTLDLVSTKLEQQSFLEGIAGGFTAKEGSKYSGAVKSATETQQSVTQSTKSAVDFRANFASSDFASMMNQVKQSQLSGKTGAEISGTVSADVFKAYMEKGAQGVTQELSKYINVQSEAGQKFKDNVISSAQTFRNNVAETMKGMINQRTDLENKLITTNKEIQSKITSSISGITEKLSSITQGPKIDPLAISKAFSEAAKISATNPEEAAKIIDRVSEQFVKFREIFGEEAARKLAESSGLGLKETQNLTAGTAASQINYKAIEDALLKSLGSNQLPLNIQKAIQAAKLDVKNVPALQKLIDEKMQGSRFDQSRKTIQAALTGVAAGKPDENKDDIKKLEDERNRTLLELKNLNERIAKFSEDFKPTGIPKSMEALSESIFNASDNVKGFQEFTSNLNRLSTTINQRLLDIERRLSQVN